MKAYLENQYQNQNQNQNQAPSPASIQAKLWEQPIKGFSNSL